MMDYKILIVDDEPMLTKMLELALSRTYDIKIAHNGKDAIEIARTWLPDLITLDVNMPHVTGYEVAKDLTNYEGTADIPIIMITAKNTIEGEVQGLESGALDYIVKPYQIDTLMQKIQSHLKHRKKVRQESNYVANPMISVPLVRSRQRSGVFLNIYKVTKRMFDFSFAALGLLVSSPILLCVAIAIRLESPGSVIFAQQRTGINGDRFKMYKFRTMVINAEELKQKYMHLNELTWPDFKITNDPRVTRVGRFFRKTSLDELPQLWNILVGDMSFVGPRPTSFKADKYELWHTERMEVRPGLTGLWQVSARAEVDLNGRSELDIEYIERQSWSLDIHILWQTVGVVLTGRGAR
jgi:lipopolysaccharide/colanic/teichoic acid biosynthesis glycosyltransferase/CheY-like chemotaxis protein